MQRAEVNEIIRNQFNRQAEHFNQWSITQNKDYMRRYAEFCRIAPGDRLLDVACGSGEFCLFVADRVRQACGVDIADRMIELARQQATFRHIANVRFCRQDAARIPFQEGEFSVVVCKSALHHMHQLDEIFTEMLRCCKTGGRISLQDIVAYDHERVNAFFEQLERNIDISHHATLSQEAIQQIYRRHQLPVAASLTVTIELNFTEYLGHAVQSPACHEELHKLLEFGLNDRQIGGYFSIADGQLNFKRQVHLILGEKSV